MPRPGTGRSPSTHGCCCLPQQVRAQELSARSNTINLSPAAGQAAWPHPTQNPSTELVGFIAWVIATEAPSPRQRHLCLPLSWRHSANPAHGAGQEGGRRAGVSASPRGSTQPCVPVVPVSGASCPPLHGNTWLSKQRPQSAQVRPFSVEGRGSKQAWKSRHTLIHRVKLSSCSVPSPLHEAAAPAPCEMLPCIYGSRARRRRTLAPPRSSVPATHSLHRSFIRSSSHSTTEGSGQFLS